MKPETFNFTKHFKISKNKVFEFQFIIEYPDKYWRNFGLTLENITRTDHGGWFFNFDILRFNFQLSFYDKRHWSHEKKCWVECDKSLCREDCWDPCKCSLCAKER